MRDDWTRRQKGFKAQIDFKGIEQGHVLAYDAVLFQLL
jgi:hypothetical protein